MEAELKQKEKIYERKEETLRKFCRELATKAIGFLTVSDPKEQQKGFNIVRNAYFGGTGINIYYAMIDILKEEIENGNAPQEQIDSKRTLLNMCYKAVNSMNSGQNVEQLELYNNKQTLVSNFSI